MSEDSLCEEEDDIDNRENEKEEKCVPDLLVMDEAHNLASTEDIKRAKKLLTDKEINKFLPLKYLFMTATPLKIIKRDKTSNYIDDEITFSMDNQRLYGEVFYEYTFYNGIREGYITDFDVVHLDDSDAIDTNYNKQLETIKTFDSKMQQEIYFKTVKDWQEYYNSLIELSYDGKETNKNIIEKIIYIPSNPKKYYLEEWKNDENDGWNTFLNKEMENTTGQQINNNPSETYNYKKNIQNLVNDDKSKVVKLIPEKWLSLKIMKTDLSKLKEYIDLEFGINCKLTPRYRLDWNYNVGIKMILANIVNINNNPPIVIGEDYKIKYDKDIYDKNKICNKKNIDRNKYKYINNGELQTIINNFSNEIEEYVKLNRKK